MKISKLSLPFLAFVQATGLVIYISLIALFMSNANQIFGKIDNSFFGPIAFLLLFIISAIVSSLIALGRAGFLFWEKKYDDALTLLGWTLGWSVLYLIIVFSVLFTSK